MSVKSCVEMPHLLHHANTTAEQGRCWYPTGVEFGVQKLLIENLSIQISLKTMKGMKVLIMKSTKPSLMYINHPASCQGNSALYI